MPIRPAGQSAHDVHGQQRANAPEKHDNTERSLVPPAFLTQTRQVPDAQPFMREYHSRLDVAEVPTSGLSAAMRRRR